MAEALVFYVRPGFEREAAQEIMAEAANAGIEGFVKAKPESGYAVFQAHEPGGAGTLAEQIDFAELVFPRQMVRDAILVADLPVGDRTGPIVAAARERGTQFMGLHLDTPDTNDGKALASLIRPLMPHLDKAFAKAGIVFDQARSPDRLNVFFIGGNACYVGVSSLANGSSWPMGIPRLRMPRGSPSRSTLKLAEALNVFLTPEQAERRMQPGMTAVDLGAAPGGWTWQLVQRHMKVMAVDNGAMDPALLETGQVKHRREDGFKYRPPEPVAWMVCDMVEQPSRIAELAARWIRDGWCKDTIFNLKLPMKKRWEEVQLCRERIDHVLGEVPARLRMKQLYHDREEVTAYLMALDPDDHTRS
ncbi:23S rRNA (cytidine(2498)-2'-O)-methyltransferase RlmM [Betaproteobacteria bacterium GR16-43]|nr:23S rRNA (cytidine(2498)-2'-O)-methyltransferase RlmM [Betaproteobacteria bacterium GR16-43]